MSSLHISADSLFYAVPLCRPAMSLRSVPVPFCQPPHCSIALSQCRSALSLCYVALSLCRSTSSLSFCSIAPSGRPAVLSFRLSFVVVSLRVASLSLDVLCIFSGKEEFLTSLCPTVLCGKSNTIPRLLWTNACRMKAYILVHLNCAYRLSGVYGASQLCT